MSILWLTTALSVIALLSAAVVLGTFALGATAYVLSRGLELLLMFDLTAQTPSSARPACRPSRRRSRQPNSWMLSA